MGMLENVYCYMYQPLSYPQYLLRFTNLHDIASSMGGNIHDQAIENIAAEKLFGIKDLQEKEITKSEKNLIQSTAEDMYLAVAFIMHADKRRFGKLQEDLENDYTKGNNNYPLDLVKAHQLLNDYKHYQHTHQPISTG